MRQNYGDDVSWWSRNCKTKIHRLYLREQASRRREQKQMENHLYESIRDLLNRTDYLPNRFITLNKLKAQIVRLHSDRLRCVLNDNADNVRTGGDHPTIYHVIKTTWRRTELTITNMKDNTGAMIHSPREIAKMFTTYLREKYIHIPTDNNEATAFCVTSLLTLTPDTRTPWQNPLNSAKSIPLLQVVVTSEPQEQTAWAANSICTTGHY
jgi:hypothetical protein